MRIKEILNENAFSRYQVMFDLFPSEIWGECRGTVMGYFNTFKGNSERLTWALKWVRLSSLHLLKQRFGPDVEKEANQLIARYSKNFGKDVHWVRSQALFQSPSSFAQSYQHFLSLPIDGIQNFKYGTKGLHDVLVEFTQMEYEFKKSGGQTIVHSGKETLVLDLGDDWGWWNLNKSGCSIEAQAMGHCGNGEGMDGQTVLSLRKRIKGGKYRPSLTFILEPDGTLGEMKGRGNEKPSPKYHDAIVELLKLPIIRGITGGGYLAKNNFSVDDLGEDRAAELVGLSSTFEDADL